MKSKFCFLIFCILNLSFCKGTTYFVSPNGNDINNGTSISSPWKTLKKVSLYSLNTGFNPGSTIKFEAEKIFEGDTSFYGSELLIVNSGMENNPITITSYDTSNSNKRATIKVRYDKIGLLCGGNEYIKISNLNFTSSFNPFNQNGNYIYNNIGIWFLTTYGSGNPTDRKNNIVIDSCKISRFSKSGISIQYSDSDRAHYGGYKNVEIKNCTIDSIGNAGIFINWIRNTLYSINDFGNKDFKINNCNIFRVTGINTDSTNNGSGIILLDIDSAIVEHNLVHSCGGYGTFATGPSAIEASQCKNVLYQFNETYNQRSNSGHDGHGLHFGDGTQNSTMQYNNSHDNDGPGYSCHTFGNNYPLSDSNNTIRYNISSKNGRKSVYNACEVSISSGNTKTIKNIKIYNNTICAFKQTSEEMTAIRLARSVSNCSFFNNIIYCNDSSLFAMYFYPVESGTDSIKFLKNIYFNLNGHLKYKENLSIYYSYISWQNAVSTLITREKINNINVGFNENPGLLNPINAGNVNNTYKLDTLTAFQTKVNSVIRENGLNLDSLFGINPGSKDFFGNTLPKGSKFDIGAYEDPTNYVLIDLTMFIEGFYNLSLEKQIGDTVTLNFFPYIDFI